MDIPDQIKVLRKANKLLKQYGSTEQWETMLTKLDLAEINYLDWTEIEILIWYLKSLIHDSKSSE